MARDPLAIVARLRRRDTEAATRALAHLRKREDAAAERASDAAAALDRERTAGAPPADYAAWLRRALPARERAEHGAALAEKATAAARIALAQARAAERGLALLRETRAKAAIRARDRRAQATLDDHAARTPARLAPATAPVPPNPVRA